MNIAKLRVEREWSQEKLAEKASVDTSTVQRWEGGSAVPCGFDICKLSSAFGVGADAIYTGLPKSVAELSRLHSRRCMEHASLS